MSVQSVLKVRVQIGERRYDEDLAIQTQITPNIEDLNIALSQQPSRFAEWAILEALARAQHDAAVAKINDLNSDLKDLEAALTLEYAGAGTVSFIAAKVQTDQRRKDLVLKIRAAEEVGRESKNALEQMIVGRKAMEQKRDSLLALASNWRQEMQTQLTVNAQQYRPGAGRPQGAPPAPQGPSTNRRT